MSTVRRVEGMTSEENCQQQFLSTTSPHRYPWAGWWICCLMSFFKVLTEIGNFFRQRLGSGHAWLGKCREWMWLSRQEGSEVAQKTVSAFRIPLLLVFLLNEHCFLDTDKHQLKTKLLTPGFSLNTDYNCMQSASYRFWGVFFGYMCSEGH